MIETAITYNPMYDVVETPTKSAQRLGPAGEALAYEASSQVVKVAWDSVPRPRQARGATRMDQADYLHWYTWTRTGSTQDDEQHMYTLRVSAWSPPRTKTEYIFNTTNMEFLKGRLDRATLQRLVDLLPGLQEAAQPLGGCGQVLCGLFLVVGWIILCVAGNAAQKRNDRALVTLNKAFAEHGLEVKRLLDMESNEDQCQGAWYDITLTCPV